MSRVYFHTQHGDAESRGSERGWLDHIARVEYWRARRAAERHGHGYRA